MRIIQRLLNRKTLYLIIGCWALTKVAAFCEKQTDGFTVIRFSSDRPYDPRWEIRPMLPEESREAEAALSQKYRYFGRGGQCYVLFSDDGKYVIKFFRQRIYKMPLWLKFVHIPFVLDRYREKKQWVRKDKLERDFSSYKIAFEELQNETGMVYVHLNKTDNLKKKLTIVDRLNIEHQLNLDEFDFIVQKKGMLVYERIGRFMEKNQVDEAKKTITRILEFIVHRCKLGYHDRDPNIRTNCGFLNEVPIKIDVGRFVRDESMKSKERYDKELIRLSVPFQEWLSKNYPSLAEYCDEELKRIVSEP